MAQQMRDNPNFMDQLNEWQSVRSERGEDPMEWNAFRDHLMAIGAPDPGFVPTNEFNAFSPPADANAMGDTSADAMAGASVSAADEKPEGE